MVYDPLFGYLGPETMLPLASFFAAIVGGLLMGWRYILMAVRRVFAVVTGRKPTDDAVATQASSNLDRQD